MLINNPGALRLLVEPHNFQRGVYHEGLALHLGGIGTGRICSGWSGNDLEGNCCSCDVVTCLAANDLQLFSSFCWREEPCSGFSPS